MRIDPAAVRHAQKQWLAGGSAQERCERVSQEFAARPTRAAKPRRRWWFDNAIITDRSCATATVGPKSAREACRVGSVTCGAAAGEVNAQVDVLTSEMRSISL